MKIRWLLPLLLLTACHKPEKAPRSPQEVTTTIDAVGTWQIPQSNGQVATVILEEDGTGTRRTNTHTQDGAWEQMGEQVWIFWDDGWIDRISTEDGHYVNESFGPGADLDVNPDHTSAARKVGARPHTSR